MNRDTFKTLYGRARQAATGYTTRDYVYVNSDGAVRLTSTGGQIKTHAKTFAMAQGARRSLKLKGAARDLLHMARRDRLAGVTS